MVVDTKADDLGRRCHAGRVLGSPVGRNEVKAPPMVHIYEYPLGSIERAYADGYAAAQHEIERLRAALTECGADWSSKPGTVIGAATELSAEFQRRMQIATNALAETR